MHSVWDTRIIEYFTVDYKSLANELINNKKTQVSLNPVDWSYESHQEAKKIYSKIINVENISRDYIAKNFPLIKSQLHKAGLTLAEVLNNIFE